MRRLMACWMLALLAVADPAGAQSEPYKVFDTRPVITHKFSYTAPTDAQRYHLLVVGQDQVARVDATSAELKVVVTATDGKVVHTLTIPAR